jgi:hypothetical protein
MRGFIIGISVSHDFSQLRRPVESAEFVDECRGQQAMARKWFEGKGGLVDVNITI